MLLSGGGTHEEIDPVRYIGNRSTGTMAVKLAQEFAALGAQVNLVAANISQDIFASAADFSPQNGNDCRGSVEIIPVVTARQLQEKIMYFAENADAVIMAAAVADYRVKNRSNTKIKRSGKLTLELEPNPDILRILVESRKNRKEQVIVGFAAETGSAEKNFYELGLEKALRKGADFLVINQVGVNDGFGNVDTVLFVVNNMGEAQSVISGSKTHAAKNLARLISEKILNR
ncbi:phosphopantothenoylcysteine decarboxylase [Arcanobacterium hippocoleae]